MNTYTLTDEDIETVAKIVRDRLYDKAQKRGGDAYVALSYAAESVRQMIPHHIRKLATK